jgi:hypothetical protein
MPIYTFAFPCGEEVDEFFKMADCPEEIERQCLFDEPAKAFECEGYFRACKAKKVIVAGHGGSFDDHPVWMSGEGGDQMREALQDSDRLALGLEEPITTRTQLRKKLKDTHTIATG